MQQTAITPEKVDVLSAPLSGEARPGRLLFSIGDNGGYPRIKFTHEMILCLNDAGFLNAEKCELIEGDIVPKMAQGFAHKTSVSLLVAALSDVFGARSLRNQADFGVRQRDPNNDPEPDVTVLQGTARDYSEREPEIDEVLLVAEVAASSLVGDTTVKTRIYGRQGIREYWVLDVEKRELHVYRDPNPSGYESHVTLSETDSVSPLAAPTASVCVADLLP